LKAKLERRARRLEAEIATGCVHELRVRNDAVGVGCDACQLRCSLLPLIECHCRHADGPKQLTRSSPSCPKHWVICGHARRHSQAPISETKRAQTMRTRCYSPTAARSSEAVAAGLFLLTKDIPVDLPQHRSSRAVSGGMRERRHEETPEEAHTTTVEHRSRAVWLHRACALRVSLGVGEAQDVVCDRGGGAAIVHGPVVGIDQDLCENALIISF
jgi:hypothetical protein